MALTSAFVLYISLWALVFFVALPIRIKTQGELGEVIPGTPSSAPAQHHLKKKAIITTVVATVIWAIITAVVLSGVLSLTELYGL